MAFRLPRGGKKSINNLDSAPGPAGRAAVSCGDAAGACGRLPCPGPPAKRPADWDGRARTKPERHPRDFSAMGSGMVAGGPATA
ncbi:hypothetical protein SLG_00420 [Sphingobium sp. SYK-6]|nr:hypothetical protein SLG_00420 [Sphingobium sp. SYK-6]